MNIEATAEELVRQALLLPDVARSAAAGPEVQVESSSGESVLVRRRDDMAGAGLFEHWEVIDAWITDVPRRPRGFAKVADGRWLHLNDKRQFVEFFYAVGRQLDSQDLARLLTRYQGADQGVDLPQNTLIELTDLRGALEPETAASITGFTELRLEPADDGGLLTFCTFFIVRDTPDRVFRVGLNRWEARWNRDGDFQLRVVPLARGLESPRYRPGSGLEAGVQERRNGPPES
ncbi:MAG: hypothetical protein GEU75_07215 [Dehalococcoidia bacterium]|nr:hypothetical protein [Dehalococcoidia bacterium]